MARWPRCRVGWWRSPGQTLVVLESMKVEHLVRAVNGGTISEVLVSVDDIVDAQQLLIRLEDPR